MALVGKLEEIPFTEVLELLAMSEKTGRLSVSTGTQEALIVFRDGKIIYSNMGDKFVRQRDGYYKRSKTWTLVHGIHDDQNPHF